MKSKRSFCASSFRCFRNRTPLRELVLVWLLVMAAGGLAYGQADSRGMTMAEYDKAKTFKLANIDNDTYVKFENAYVLDRYEMKPPYVFKYSDGIERRFYLYKLLDNQTRKDLGMVAIYHLPASGKTLNLPIPNATADKQVWTRYIDDLKELGEKEGGFLSAFSYTLSRELSTMLGKGSGQSSPVSQSKIDYDVCFPAGALVTLPDGSQRPIESLKAGEAVAAYNPASQALEATVIKAVEVHQEKSYPITSIMAVRKDVLVAFVSKEPVKGGIRLEATDNHPVLTKNGRKSLGDVQTGDIIYCYDSAQEAFAEFEVRVVSRNYRSATQVYNLITGKQNFLVNDAVVLDK